jgi:uroporphyrinogen decarboxylase
MPIDFRRKPLLAKLHACEGSPTPIWIMRQAGRYLPQYRAVREKFKDFMEFCLTPQAAAEVTLQPVEYFGMDGAIIFSDILIIPKALGMQVEFVEHVGPKLGAIKEMQDVYNYTQYDEGIFHKVGEAIAMAKSMLDAQSPTTTLIGFAGGPFTIAAYMIEGGGSRDFARTIQFALQHPEAFNTLLKAVTVATIKYLKIQIASGAEVIKLFDSWAGIVPQYLFEQFVVEPLQQIAKALKDEYNEIPIIAFMRGAGSKLRWLKHIDALAIDQYQSLNWCFENFKNTTPNAKIILQGNLDNALLAYGNQKQIMQEAKKIMEIAKHNHLIFNLGHGILPNTPVANVRCLIDLVRET